ncbi:MAG: hypothetical protein MJ178_02025 [Treponemataceae bacterium]|nr:hypothetical protein [Treponemataceae bacterium]
MKNVAEKSFSNQNLGNGNAKLNTAGFSYHAVSCFYLWGTADYTARLTAENQGYSLFPYKTYTLDGTSSFSFIGASCKPRLTAGSFSISCLISGLYCLNETSDILRWWIYKNSLIFDGSYGDSRTTTSTITHTGLFILRPEILYRHQFGSVSASKLFPVPINMKNDPMSDNMTATDYLSGGFTISVSFQF